MDWHMRCPQCGYYGLGKRVLPGSDSVEKVLWCLLIVPGFAYRLWRRQNARVGCTQCSWQGPSQETAE